MPVSVSVPGPACVSPPAPETVPPNETVPLRSKASVAPDATATSPTIEPPAPPLPICSVPWVTVVLPV